MTLGHSPKNIKKRRRVHARVDDESCPRTIAPFGRDGQTLEAFVASNGKGITSQDVGGWAVRLSHYVFKLRTVYGLTIETVEEEHGGEFPGKHGRYFLRSNVTLLEESVQ